MQLTLILIYLGFICIINSNHEKNKSAPGPSVYTKFLGVCKRGQQSLRNIFSLDSF